MKFRNTLFKSDQEHLDRAVILAGMSEGKFKHGAVIRKNGKTIAVGINRMVNDPYFLDDETAAKHSSVHAEVAALNACRKTNLRGATIYVARVNNKGTPSMSKPCDNCQKALIERGISKVFYTNQGEMSL